MKKYFNEYEATNDEGNRVQQEFKEFAKNIVQRENENGFSIRELEALLVDEINMICSETRLTNAIKKHNEKHM